MIRAVPIVNEEPNHDRPSRPLGRLCPARRGPVDLRRVVHLHRRAGFAATWDELQRDLKDGPEASIGRLLAGKSRAGASRRTSRARPPPWPSAATGDPGRLKAWWVYRMLFGPDPLGERLTLMWHDHFATSNLQGRRPGRHAAAERDASASTPGPRSASCSTPSSATRPCSSGSTPRPTARGTPTRTSPAS